MASRPIAVIAWYTAVAPPARPSCVRKCRLVGPWLVAMRGLHVRSRSSGAHSSVRRRIRTAFAGVNATVARDRAAITVLSAMASSSAAWITCSVNESRARSENLTLRQVALRFATPRSHFVGTRSKSRTLFNAGSRVALRTASSRSSRCLASSRCSSKRSCRSFSSAASTSRSTRARPCAATSAWTYPGTATPWLVSRCGRQSKPGRPRPAAHFAPNAV